jgi:hypothetical protein
LVVAMVAAGLTPAWEPDTEGAVVVDGGMKVVVSSEFPGSPDLFDEFFFKLCITA